MDRQKPTAPLDSQERVAAARLLEAVHDALCDERISHDDKHHLVGYRAHVLDRLRSGRYPVGRL
jgi:hypothetical protein